MAKGHRFLPDMGDFGSTRFSSGFFSTAGVFVAAVISLGVSHVMVSRFGLEFFVIALTGIFVGTVYTAASFRNLMFPFIVWLLTIGGFRFLWSIRTPLLPDLFLDRLMMIWLTGVFMVKFVAERRPFRGPHKLDLLMAVYAMYLFIRIYLQGMDFLNPWTQSTLIPYAAYFFAKNIITDYKRIKALLFVLLALLTYYCITSIGEKFVLSWLVFPKSILTERTGFAGRSVGPFMQAPLFGTIIGMLLPVFLYFIAQARDGVTRFFLLLGLAAGFAGLYFTYTRGSWLAGVMAMVTVTVLNPRKYLKIFAPMVILVPLLAVSFLGLGQDKFMKERVENDDTLGSRFGTAATALRIFKDNPVIGVGYFQFRQAREDYIQPVDVPGLGTIRFVQFRHNHIHDIYLGPLAENGLVGALLQGGIYFLILQTFIRKFRWRSRGDPVAYYVLPVFAGVFVGYLAGGLAIDYRFFAFTDTLFYMCAGILYGYQGPEQQHVS